MDFRWEGGRGETIHLKITYTVLAKLFKVKVDTVRHWVSNKKLDPTNLEDIVRLYNEKHKV